MSAIRAGYKQTEVGVIPEDWAVKSLEQISEPVRGGSPRPAGDPRFFNGTYIPWLTVAALTNIPESRLVVTETATCLTEEGSLRSRTLLPGTLIIANSGATLGVAKILGVRCCANDGIAALLNIDKNVSAEYLAHFINTRTVYLRDVVATGNGQPNLNTGLIGDFSVPLPTTKEEQEAIAEALSDADALIESLEQLLAKKRHLKQGTMQELLTGKKRLPGFSGEWVLRTLDSVVDALEAGVSVNSLDSLPHTGEPNILKTSAMADGRFMPIECKAIAPFDISRARANPRRDTILISRMNTPDLVGEVGYVDDDYPWLFLPDRIWMTRFRVGSEICVRWLAYLLSSTEYKRLIQGAATGTSGSMKNISKPGLMALPVRFPSYSEQTAIASALSDMDAELADLEAQLAKTRALKQGMMQKLLTGEIRLL